MLTKRITIGLLGSLLIHIVAVAILAVITLSQRQKLEESVVEVEVITVQKYQEKLNDASHFESMEKKGAVSPKTQISTPQNVSSNYHQRVTEQTRSTSSYGQSTPAQKENGESKVNAIGESVKASGKESGITDGTSLETAVDNSDDSAAASGGGRGYYDSKAIRQEIQGTVTVRAILTAAGVVQGATVISSSGNSTIDSMGIRDMYAGDYTPRKGKDGRYAASYIIRTFTYTLR